MARDTAVTPEISAEERAAFLVEFARKRAETAFASGEEARHREWEIVQAVAAAIERLARDAGI